MSPDPTTVKGVNPFRNLLEGSVPSPVPNTSEVFNAPSYIYIFKSVQFQDKLCLVTPVVIHVGPGSSQCVWRSCTEISLGGLSSL